MRILHSADIHLGDLPGPVVNGQNARLLDTLRCFDFLVDYAQREQPDAILISGDLFDKSKLWGDNMLSLIDAATQRLRLLAEVAPTVLMFGTDNHDSMKAFENIRNMNIHGLRVITKPELLFIDTISGPLEVACLPGFDKGYFRAKNPGMVPAEESVMCSKLLGDIVNGLSAQLEPTIPSVLMAHYTVVGCELDNGQHVFTQSEVVLPKEALVGSAFDLVALGHIHRAQQVECAGKPVFYSGPVNGITFNEEGQDKGFWMHEIDQGAPFGPHYIGSEFIKTPYREFHTLKVDFTDCVDLQARMKWALAGEKPDDPPFMYPTVGAIVRVEYECTEEQRPLLNHKEMESLIKSGGAFHVAEIKTKRIVTALTKQELTETSGPLENLHTWLTTEGFSAEDTTLILELSKPLIATISAKMPTGTLSGVFEPRSLTVKNYRSYLEETFNFQDIYFATVNGPNGIGKSAFFMDSLSDCIYEETRTGVTGSWITNGQTEGSMWFEFSMGSSIWRVVRARSIKGSGKIVLALDEFINGEWVNRSGTTAKATQEKIEALLGMDCATFRCTALIMQDAYGLFMEADKEARMSVLANILGLSLYEELTDLAKAKVSELNKSLAISKAKLADLDEKLKDKTRLVIELSEAETDIDLVKRDMEIKEAELKAAEELVHALKSKAEKAEEIRKQIDTLKSELLAKNSDIIQNQKQTERAQQILANEATIIAKADEYQRVKDQVLVLETKQPKVLELMNDHSRVTNDIAVLNTKINTLAPQITELENVLASKPGLDLAANRYQEELITLEIMDALGTKDTEIDMLILSAEKDVDEVTDLINLKQLKLNEFTQKSSMLAKSNCVDPVNAKCAFLADAQFANSQIPFLEEKIRVMQMERIPLVKLVEELEVKRKALGYVSADHYYLKESVNALRPKAELAGQLYSKSELLKGIREQLADCEKRRTELQAQLKEINESDTALRTELAVLPSLNERLPKLLQWVFAKDELPAARQVVLSTADIIKGIEADIATKESQIKTMEEEQLVISSETIGLPTAEQNVNKFYDDLKLLHNRQLDCSVKIGAITSQLEALAKDEAERKQVADEMEPAAKSLTRYQTLTKAFGIDGIPFSIVRSVVPELSATSNEILGQMTGGKMALEMKTERVQKSNKKEVNALEVWIIDWRGNIPYKDRSGGQKVKAALANAFALADLKARRVGIQLGMMFVDEPPFLDSEGVEAYCDALEGLNHRYPNMRVIAISHDPAMKARFPQQIEVVDMGDEGSKVRIA
ncbi:MAG: exonuclease subunit SbcD [Desulfosporosinus sp.]